MLGSFVPLAQESGSNSSGLLIFLVLMFALFYFLMIRPQQKRQRAQRDLMASLAVGDEVLTVGGMFGTIQAVEDDSITVEVAPGIEVRLLKSAIARKLGPVEEAEYEDEEYEDEQDEEYEEDQVDEEEEAGDQK